MRIECGDFFKGFEGDEKTGRFDIVWDCTFLCALNPKTRVRWARRCATLLKPGTGELWVCVFPMWNLADDSDNGENLVENPGDGPPYELSFALLDKLLAEEGFECTHKV